VLWTVSLGFLKKLRQKVCKLYNDSVRTEYLIPSAIPENSSLSAPIQSFALSISSIYSNIPLGRNTLLKVAFLLENGREK